MMRLDLPLRTPLGIESLGRRRQAGHLVGWQHAGYDEVTLVLELLALASGQPVGKAGFVHRRPNCQFEWDSVIAWLASTFNSWRSGQGEPMS